MKILKDWNFKLSEFYLLPSIVLYKNQNNNTKWKSIRMNIFKFQLEFLFFNR